MANGYFERGEVYWIKLNDAIGSEEGVGRPGLIVSSDEENNRDSLVNVAYSTTSRARAGGRLNVFTRVSAPRDAWIQCNQIYTVDKSRLTKLVGKLTQEEMRNVDDALESRFGLGYVDDVALAEKDREIEILKEKIAAQEAEIEGCRISMAKRETDHEEELLSYKVENAMWQRCYDRALDQIAKMKVKFDVSRRTPAEPKVGTVAHMVPDLRPEPPKQPEEPVLEKKIELNGCTETDLRKCGCTDAQARCIRNYRPYTKVEDLLCTPGVTRALFDILQDKVYCEPPIQDDRLDINSCTATALKKIGFSLAMARKIVESRPFKSVEDLKRVSGLKTSQFRIMAPKLCCNPVVVAEEPPVEVKVDEPPKQEKKPKVVWDGVKVNINTIKTITQLQERTGMCQRTASEIIRHREQFGNYEKVDDLLNLKSFGGIAMNRYGHMLEV